MRFFLLFLMVTVLLFANKNKLTYLLQNYESEHELYHQTKVESAGHVIVFSHRDLDRMQVYTLKDILKIIPAFTLQTSRLGLTNLVVASASIDHPSYIKFYIDDYEYPSDLTQDIIYRYGDMSLYFIDHIEIYQGATSIAFGNELGTMVIKLYTKKADRENATSVQTGIDSKGGYFFYGLSAKKTKYFDYLAFIDNSMERFDRFTNRYGNRLSKDALRQQIHLKFYKDKKWSLDMDLNKRVSDPFIGLGQKPLSGTHKNYYGLIGFTRYFPGKIKLSASSSKEYISYDDFDDNTIKLYDDSLIKHLSTSAYSINSKIKLEKRKKFGANDLLMGLQYINKQVHIDKLKADGVEKPIPNVPKRMNIIMGYAENSYNFDKNNVITLSAKLDHYDIQMIGVSNQYSFRLGYISIYDKKTTIKLFAMHDYIAPKFDQTSFAPTFKANQKLDTTKENTISSELIYKPNDKSNIDIKYGYYRMKNPIIFSKLKNQYINLNITAIYRPYTISYSYKFDYNNKLKIEYFANNHKNALSPERGALLELFNTFGKFDFYNQLSYRSSYSIYGSKIDNGYDYTSAITYRYNKDLTFKLKGINLFDDDSKVFYQSQGVQVSAVDRRVIFSVEYTF